MPSVPMLNRPQVAPNVRRAIDVLVESTGAGAAAMGLSIAADAFQKERERAGQIRANAAEAEIRQVSSRLATEVERMQRTNALGAEDFVAEKWGTEVSRITAGISDPAVRQAVEARANILRDELQGRARTHAMRESERSRVEDFKTNQASDLTSIASLPANEGEAILVRIAERTRENAMAEGKSQAVVDAEVQAAASAARLAQVGGMVRGQRYAEAIKFLEREDVMGQMRPADYADAKKVVDTVRVDLSVNAEAERILASTTDPVERNEMVKSVPIEFRKQVRDLVQAENRASKEAETQRQEQAFDAVQQHVLNGGSLSDPSIAIQRSRLSVSQTETLQKYTMAPTNDNKAWLDFYEKTPEQIAAMTESEFRSHWSRLSTSHRDDAERMRKAVTQQSSSPDGVRGYITPQDQIARGMRAVAGIPPFAPMTQANEDQQAKAIQFQNAADLALRQEKAAKKRDLTPDEVQATLDRLRLDTFRSQEASQTLFGRVIGGGVIGPSGVRIRETVRPAFELPADSVTNARIRSGQIALTADRIPDDAKVRIRNILTGNGLVGTDRQIETYYAAELFGDVTATLNTLRGR